METDEKSDDIVGRTFAPVWRRASSPPQLDFPPIRNGVDYVVSVIDHLDEYESEVGPRRNQVRGAASTGGG
ncbi:hypothetical protein [Streptomyces sp. NPDC002133]|uniref:hypothetical protein n=1 Tax=Streptomyces sp. NPDC002133 TaxID=3154409 RepID=UPI0033319180